MKLWLRSVVLVVTVVTLSACSDQERPAVNSDPGGAPAAEAALALATEAGIRNARMPVAGLITAGQPTEDQLDGLRAAGVEHFVSLRPTSEDGAGWEEARASSEGFSFDRLPIAGAASLTRENVETFAAIMERVGDEPALLYCASSNRVGAMIALKAHWIDGDDAETALELGRSAGLASLENPVRELMGLGPSRP